MFIIMRSDAKLALLQGGVNIRRERNKRLPIEEEQRLLSKREAEGEKEDQMSIQKDNRGWDGRLEVGQTEMQTEREVDRNTDRRAWGEREGGPANLDGVDIEALAAQVDLLVLERGSSLGWTGWVMRPTQKTQAKNNKKQQKTTKNSPIHTHTHTHTPRGNMGTAHFGGDRREA
jgi:hypothetical protein